MKDLLMTAYDMKAYQVSGPDWMATERYDLIVKVPEGATKAQVNAMWQNLLAERFGVALHHESREFQVEDLVVARDGPRLKETVEDLTAPLPPGPSIVKDGELLSPGVVVRILPGPSPRAHTVARAQPISQLAAMLSNQLNRPVLDKTGLTGKYDFTLDYNLSGFALPPPSGREVPGLIALAPGDTASEPGPDIAAAVQQQLGLRLVASKAKLDLVIVDKANKVPTDN
jgi:uncharacterized protein (TIGR03435 family)